MMRLESAIGWLLLVLAGCSATTPPTTTLPPVGPAPSVVTGATYGDAYRSLIRLDVTDPARQPLRNRIVAYLFSQTDEILDEGDFEILAAHFATVTELYTPEEIGEGKLPRRLERLARRLIELGSPRGDEARVLSGMLVLRLLHPDDAKAAEDYDRLVQWGMDTGGALNGPLDRFDGLVQVWEEHVRLTPTHETMRRLAEIYVERRDTMVKLFSSSEHRIPVSAEAFEGVQRTGLSVAAVFLRHGDTSSALTNLQAMGTSGGGEERLVQVLEMAREDGMEGAGALLDLSRAYLESGDPEVAHALCIDGLRRRRNDARFQQCLARIAATESDYDGAMAWYAEAVRMVPEERALYDEILEVLNNLMEHGLFSTEPASTRKLANRAAEILEERMRRWPDSPPPVKPEDLFLAIGIAEMNAGNAEEAETRFAASLKARENIEALLQLGLLVERTGRGAEAAALYRRALNLAQQQQEQRQQAEILERLGDALRLVGKGREATQVYREGLALWDANLSRLKGRRKGLAQLRRGILLGRLQRSDDALAAFEKAMAAAPELRETYATILAYMVVSHPEPGFAHRVFRSALNQLSLEPEWKVYFALWLRTISSRRGQPTDADVDTMFEDLSTGEGWWAKLARFAAGKLSYNGLLAEATNVGERTEAHFYEGVRLLREGKVDAAQHKFQEVLQTRMVNFYEFAMAQELLADPARLVQANPAGEP